MIKKLESWRTEKISQLLIKSYLMKTYTAAGTRPLIPILSLSDGGKAKPLLKIGSEINGMDFLWTSSARKYFPPIIFVEIHLSWLEKSMKL